MSSTPRPGDFGLSMGEGWTGWGVNLGQALLKDSSRYTHAFIVLNDKLVIESKPSGAGFVPMSRYEGRAVFCDLGLTDQQRLDIVKHALELKGTPYSFLDYASLATYQWGIRPEWLKDYVKNTGHMICSQLVDEVYLRSGIHLFNDGRLPQDVTPGDLFYRWIEYLNSND